VPAEAGKWAKSTEHRAQGSGLREGIQLFFTGGTERPEEAPVPT